MKILTVNCGSSSLRFDIFEVDSDLTKFNKIFSTHSKNIGSSDSAVDFKLPNNIKENESLKLDSHAHAIEHAIDKSKSLNISYDKEDIVVGHRIVHGGEIFKEPTVLDDEKINLLDSLKELSPLHHGPALDVIRALRNMLGENTKMFACFDTTFHNSLPDYARQYAIPAHLTKKYDIYRYGFHGLAHRSMASQLKILINNPTKTRRLITLQLGNGCSICAIKNGESIETSMGFTPLEGLMMGTRSGDLDPSLLLYISKKENISVEEVNHILNSQSGLLGVSQVSSDMSELLTLEKEGHAQAHLAIEMFCYKVKKMLGAYFAILGGADAIVFGGGIGENSPEIRERICSNLDFFGLQLDLDKNKSPTNYKINHSSSSIKAYVLQPSESEIIAEDVLFKLQLHKNHAG